MKYPKTVAAIQKRDHSLWDIGDALLTETDVGGSHDELTEVAAELEHLKIDGYSVERLRKLRAVAKNFPRRARRASMSWDVHCNAGSPEMLESIVAGIGNKPVTRDRVRAIRQTVEERQARDYREEHPGKPVPKRGHAPPPSAKEVRGLALMAEIAEWVNHLGRAASEIQTVDKGLTEAKLAKIDPDDADYLVDRALTVLDLAKGLAEKIKPLRSSKRANLSVVA